MGPHSKHAASVGSTTCFNVGEAPASNEAKPLLAVIEGDPAALNEATRAHGRA